MPIATRSPWTLRDSEKLYRIDRWGASYFGVNAAGHVEVLSKPTLSPHTRSQPLKTAVEAAVKPPAGVDLYTLVLDLQARGIQLPLIVRFSHIVEDRIRQVCERFNHAIRTLRYPNVYKGVYPIKVNQQRHLVEEVVAHGRSFQFGLEAGSKPELLIALANLDTPGALLVCNGYKDRDYIETALLAQRLGRTSIIVLERLHELTLVIEASQRLGIAPILGVRAKLATEGIGRWGTSAGDRAKFGLTASEILEVVARLHEADMLSCLQLLHYHIGSQISTVSVHGRAVREASQLYVELVKLGASMGYLDIGGGLGIDYNGSQSTAQTSQSYDLEDYAVTVVQTVLTTCQEHGVAPPVLVTESGRAIMSHQSVLVFDVVGVNPNMLSLPGVPETDALVVHQMDELYHEISSSTLTANYRRAHDLKNTALREFTDGFLSLQERARVERLFWNCCDKICNLAYSELEQTGFDPVGLRDLDEMLSSTYYGNFSLFQSVPDSWAIDQVFPIMPLHRLDEEPRQWGTLADLTCDSDGRINRFFDESGEIASVLPLHEPNGDPYLIGIFLTGAYQEILGDLHNLFGDTNAVHVQLQDDGYRVTQVVKGDTVSEVLSFVQYNVEDLVEQVHHSTEAALQQRRITLAEARMLQAHFEESLRAYTYLR